MSLTIKENAKPNLTVCKMNCDDGLHEKLDNYELTKFLNSHTTTLMLGRPRSGKTSMLYSLFKSPKLLKKTYHNIYVFKSPKLLKKTYHNIYVFQPSASRASMKDNIFGSLDDDQLFEELSYDNLHGVLDIIKAADHSENHCIIFDDQTAYLKNISTLQMLKEMIFNRRHLHLSIFFLVQTWYSIPKDIRKLFNNAFIFKISKNEMENIFEEVIEKKKDMIPAISKIVFDAPYNFLFINIESQKMFKNWDSIEFKDDDSTV
jgi:hypothetical protein